MRQSPVVLHSTVVLTALVSQASKPCGTAFYCCAYCIGFSGVKTLWHCLPLLCLLHWFLRCQNPEVLHSSVTTLWYCILLLCVLHWLLYFRCLHTLGNNANRRLCICTLAILLLCLLHWLLYFGCSHVLGNNAAVQNVPLVLCCVLVLS